MGTGASDRTGLGEDDFILLGKSSSPLFTFFSGLEDDCLDDDDF